MRFARLLARIAPWILVAFQVWLVDRLLKQHGCNLLSEAELRDHLARVERTITAIEGQNAPEPRSSNTTSSPTTNMALYAPYQRMQDEAIRSTPPYPAEQFGGAGIVMLAGGPRYYTNAWVCLTMLRRVLGCRLPIQVWYRGPDEMSPQMIDMLHPFDVECIDALEVRRGYPTRTFGGWELKSYAILHCPFKDVIWLDADNVPLIDPSILLSRPEYQATGAIFWPDLGSIGRESAIWEICRVPYRDEPAFETGQIVVDKERCWNALQLTRHLNEWSDFYYGHIHGDKETFHMAWRMLNQPYSMPVQRPRWVTGLISPGDTNFADLLYQHDFEGQVIFQHRTGAKWTAWGENLHVPGFSYEDVCLEALRELREQWDGRIDLTSAVADVTGSEAEIIRTRSFLYRRVGTDQRVLTLLPDGRIEDGASQHEQTWHIEEQRDRDILVLEGYAGVTCTLTRSEDGMWRGRWLHYEQMPVELIPLGCYHK